MPQIPAQRLYAKCGYIPDGQGFYFNHKQIEEGDTVIANDDLVLHLVKALKG